MFSMIRNALTERITPQDTGTAEQRRHARRAVLLDASIYPIDFFSDVVIHNVSSNGFMGEADVELSVDDVLHLSLDEKAYQTGTVRWTDGVHFGVSFACPLARTGAGDEIEVGTLEGQKPRARRSTLNIPGRLSLGRPPQPATVRNLSQSGMLLETDPGLVKGQQILVKLGDRSPVAGRVQWHDAGRIGVETAEPIGILSLVYSND